MLLPGYDLQKAAQVVAFFAMKQGGSINVLKVSKLVYLAERECMRLYDEPMFFDKLASLPDGPVASITLNFMNGNNTDDKWNIFVGRRSGYNIPLANRAMSINDFDRLSDADIDILETIWAKFKSFNQYEIRDWTHVHENIPEWQDPEGSSSPIHHLTVFNFLGKQEPEALEKNITEFRDISKTLGVAC
jgi:uncharacterized phage-associated protein